MRLENGDPLLSRRCGNEQIARYVAETAKKDLLRTGWAETQASGDGRATGLTFPAVRAIVQEIFTALLFAAKPRYMHWMEQAKHELQLRI